MEPLLISQVFPSSFIKTMSLFVVAVVDVEERRNHVRPMMTKAMSLHESNQNSCTGTFLPVTRLQDEKLRLVSFKVNIFSFRVALRPSNN